MIDKHTPGPCRLARYGMGELEFWIVDADNRPILDMALAQPARTTEEMFANGLLWAASGDLLVALRAVEWVEIPGDGFMLIDVCPWCDARKENGHADDCSRQAAIAKAREEQCAS